MGFLNISSAGVLGKKKRRHRVPKIVPPATYADAQSQYRQILLEKAALGDIEGKRETNKASILDQTLAALSAAFPGLDLSRDYVTPAEAADTERPATLSEIQSLANSIPIPSLGVQGSSAPPLTTEEATTGSNSRTWLIAGAAGLVLIAVFFFLRK